MTRRKAPEAPTAPAPLTLLEEIALENTPPAPEPEPEPETPKRPLAVPELEAALGEFARLEDEVATLDEQLKDAKARLKYLGESTIVELVSIEYLNDGVRLADGREFVFERDVKCGITQANKLAAFQYLEEKGADSMLKRYLTLSFGKDSKASAARIRAMIARVLPEYEVGIKVGKAPETLVEALREILRASNINIEIEETLELPGATLSSFVKKELKAGRSLPEAFGVYAPLRAIEVTPALAVEAAEEALADRASL